MQIKPNALCQVDILTFLERIETGQANLVYLDPPWFTARFIEESPDESDEKRKNYFVLLSKVIQQTHRILSETGNTFLHIEPSLAGHYRLMLDQTFGNKNFRAEFIRPTRIRPDLSSSSPKITHEIIYFYSKSDNFVFNPQFKSVDNDLIFSQSDEKGSYKFSTLLSFVARPHLQFEWQGYTPPPKQSWRYTKSKLDELLHAGKIVLPGKDKSGTPKLKVYSDESSKPEVGSVWDDISAVLSPNEKIKSGTYQRPIGLFDRIIRMGSNESDLVVIPFCSSDTPIISAINNNRRWIAHQSSSDALDISLKSLEALGLQIGSDFDFNNDQALIETKFNRIPFYYVPLITSEDIPLKPLVITEGKTDWKHLKSAYLRLKKRGFLKDFEIEFREYEDDIEMGDSTLGQLCQSLAKLPNIRKIICIFDRDKSSIVEKYSGQNSPFKSWGNNVFSFALPIPNHRNEEKDISIEFYYSDNEIKQADNNGRRLYFSSEFSEKSGRHIQDSNLIYRYQPKLEQCRTFIIDSGVINANEENIALSKNQFANYVFNGTAKFDHFQIDEFISIFNIIVEIAMS